MEQVKPYLKHISFAFVFILLVILQKSISFSGFTLNFSLVFVIGLAILLPPLEALIWGAVSGLSLDLITTMPLSMNALLYMFLAFGVSMFARSFYRKRWFIIVLFFAVSSFLYNLSVYLIFAIDSRFGNFFSLLWTTILPDMIFMILFGYLFYFILEKVNGYFD